VGGSVMKDVIIVIGVVLGIILLVIGSKVKKNKGIKITGILMVSISIIIAAPDIISGFIEGFRDGFS
jgi:uncharacterized membrane protein